MEYLQRYEGRVAGGGTIAVTTDGRLRSVVSNIIFQNPIVLAAGTAGYGEELSGVMRLDALGGFVTKAVSLEPRAGAPAPRVAEFDGGMINAVGLANPGLEAVRREHLPWLASHHPGVRKIVNVVGSTVDEYLAVVAGLDEGLARGTERRGRRVRAERQLSERAGGRHGVRRRSGRRCAAVVERRAATNARPLFVKLSPTLAEHRRRGAHRGRRRRRRDQRRQHDSGTWSIDVERRRPALGFGTGGVSGRRFLPVGVLATWKVRQAVALPILGVGGVATRGGRASVHSRRRVARRRRHGGAEGSARAGAHRWRARRVVPTPRVDHLLDLSGSLEWPNA